MTAIPLPRPATITDEEIAGGGGTSPGRSSGCRERARSLRRSPSHQNARENSSRKVPPALWWASRPTYNDYERADPRSSGSVGPEISQLTAPHRNASASPKWGWTQTEEPGR